MKTEGGRKEVIGFSSLTSVGLNEMIEVSLEQQKHALKTRVHVKTLCACQHDLHGRLMT